MSVFGSTPIDPRSTQASLAAQNAALKPNERGRPAVEAGQRMKDAREQRVAGTESDSAIRKVADEHAESDADGHRRERDRQNGQQRGRRDGRRDAYVASKSTVTNAKSVNPNAAPQRIDREADGTPRRFDLKA